MNAHTSPQIFSRAITAEVLNNSHTRYSRGDRYEMPFLCVGCDMVRDAEVTFCADCACVTGSYPNKPEYGL